MPKQKRWLIKRQLAQAVLACDKAQNYLVTAGKEYETAHPDYYSYFCQVVRSLEIVKAGIKSIEEQI